MWGSRKTAMFFFSSRRPHTRFSRDWSSDVCSSDLRTRNRLMKSKVDVEQFVAWKDGFFIFDGLSPETALTQLARWYDVDVVYDGDIPTGRFFGMIDRSKSLSTILKVLKRSGINFELRQEKNRNQLIVRNQ